MLLSHAHAAGVPFPCLALFFVLAVQGAGVDLYAADGPLPDDARIVNVRVQYGAKGDGVSDDTAAIQKAIDEHPNQGAIIYLPIGTYLVSSRLSWPRPSISGHMYKNLIMQGEDRDRSIIRLRDGAEYFQDAQEPDYVLWTGGPPAQRFRNAIRNLTVDTGDNPGAIGVNFYASNSGCMRNVTIQSGPAGKGRGLIGLDMSLNEVGPQLISHVSIIGFDTGIRVGSHVNSITCEYLDLSNQRVCGIRNEGNLIWVRKFTFTGSVPALVSCEPLATTLFMEATITGNGEAACKIEDGFVTLRDVQVSGFTHAAQGPAGVVDGPMVSEWTSHVPIGLGAEPHTLRLPVEETPDVPWDDPKTWADVRDFGGNPDDDQPDAEAIQKAIDSGATTIFLVRAEPEGRQGGNWLFDRTVIIRGNVRRIIGLEAVFSVTEEFDTANTGPLWRMDEKGAPVVVIERMWGDMGYRYHCRFVEHAVSRTLVLRDIAQLGAPLCIAPAKVFLEDCVGSRLENRGASVWGRHVNIEGTEARPVLPGEIVTKGGSSGKKKKGADPDVITAPRSVLKLKQTGGSTWILGFKTEACSPLVELYGNAHMEVMGGHLYTCVRDNRLQKMFSLSDQARLSLAASAEYCWSNSWSTATLIQYNDQELLPDSAMPVRRGGNYMPLVAVGPGVNNLPAKEQAVVGVPTMNGASISLPITLPAGTTGVRILRDGIMVGWSASGLFIDPNVVPHTEYAYQLSVQNAAGQLSDAQTIRVNSGADTIPPEAVNRLRSKCVLDRLVALAWGGAEDGVGVTSYQVERFVGKDDQANLVQRLAAGPLDRKGRPALAEWTDETVVPDTQYRYRVTAFDAEGNQGPQAVVTVQVPVNPPATYKVTLADAEKKSPDAKARNGRLYGLHVGLHTGPAV